MRHRTQHEPFSLFAFQDIIMCVTGVVILLTLLLVLDFIRRQSLQGMTASPSSSDDTQASVSQLDEQITKLRQTLDDGQTLLVNLASLSSSAIDQEQTRLHDDILRLKSEMIRLEADLKYRNQVTSELLAKTNDAAPENDLVALRKRIEELQRKLKAVRAENHLTYNASLDSKKSAWLVDLSPTAIRVMKPGPTSNTAVFESRTDSSGIERFLEWTRSKDTNTDYLVLLIRPKALAVYRQVYPRLKDLKYDIGVDLLETHATLVESDKLRINP